MLRSPTLKPGSKLPPPQKKPNGLYGLILSSQKNGFENSIYNNIRKNKMQTGDVAWWCGRQLT